MSKAAIRTIHTVLIAVSLVFLATAAEAARIEPRKPDPGHVFSAKKEAVIAEMASLPPEKAFERLKDADFLGEDEYIAKGVYQSFRNRKKEGIDPSIRLLAFPLEEFAGGREINRARDQYVAKKIFEMFPEESIPELMRLFHSGDPVVRGNVIRVSGKIEGVEITSLLMGALNDKAYAESEHPEVDGPPMRICDLAYNQLVLRFKVKGVLRGIGPSHRLEVRDYHISMLSGRI